MINNNNEITFNTYHTPLQPPLPPPSQPQRTTEQQFIHFQQHHHHHHEQQQHQVTYFKSIHILPSSSDPNLFKATIINVSSMINHQFAVDFVK